MLADLMSEVGYEHPLCGYGVLKVHVGSRVRAPCWVVPFCTPRYPPKTGVVKSNYHPATRFFWGNTLRRDRTVWQDHLAGTFYQAGVPDCCPRT